MSIMELKVFNRAEIEKLHRTTLELLANPGVRIAHAPTLARLAKAGANVDTTNELVRFPCEMVEELLREAPSTANLAGLNGKTLEVGGMNRYYTSLVLDPFIIDYVTGPRRPVLEDVRRNTIVGESLDRVSGMMRMQYPLADVPREEGYLKSMEVFLRHTAKHILIYPTSVENGWDWIGAAEILAGDRGLKHTPLLSVAVAVTSPLVLHGVNAELLGMALEHNLPIIPTTCPMAGSTCPYTVAGTMLQANVEALLPLLVAQALKPGHPVFYGAGPSVIHLHSGHNLYYKAEKMLFKLALTQMGKFYRLPVMGEAAGTMTWRYDPQNGAEGMLYLLASVVGGQNLYGGLGSCHNAIGMSAEQIVIQCGLADLAEYVARGMNLSDDELGLESIRSAGPGGHFLTDDLTLRYMHGDQFFKSPHFDLSGGYRDSPGMVAMAHQTVEQLVSDYKPTVPENIQEDLRRYFERRMAVSGACGSV